MDPRELLRGMEGLLHVYFTPEELITLTMHLDDDKSGSIDQKEFTSKIGFNNMHVNSHKYLVSEHRFIEFVLALWYEYRADQIKEVVKKIK